MQDLISLRSFLEVDRVSVCQFTENDEVKVVAESINDNRLPPLLSSSFPLEGVLPLSRQLFFQSRTGAMVNVAKRTVFQIPPSNLKLDSFRFETLTYLDESSQIVKHLTDTGVTFYLVMPIFHQETAWGLLMAHHSEVSFISNRKLEVLGMLVSQLSATIAQDVLRTQVQTQAEQEKVLHRIDTLLQSSSTPDFQTALESTVATFQGSGGRLCMRSQIQTPPYRTIKDFISWLNASGRNTRAYTCGLQPAIPTKADAKLMDYYRLWPDHFASGSYQIWAIADLYQVSELQPLFNAFRPTPIHSLLMLPLVYRQQFLGYLSIFRNAAASNDAQSERVVPVREWTDLKLAQMIGQRFATAAYENELSQQLHDSNVHLNTELQQHAAQLKQVAQQQKGLSDVLNKIQSGSDLETIFQTTTKDLCKLLQAERLAVYRFNADWGGEFIHNFEYVVPKWQRAFKLGKNTAWNDTYLQETQGGRYRYNETFEVENIYEAGLSSCHSDILEQFQIKAFSTAPIFVGKHLWGVLAAYQHSQFRHWTTTDVLFLSQTASALGLALKQAELLAQSQDSTTHLQTLSKELDLGSGALPSN